MLSDTMDEVPFGGFIPAGNKTVRLEAWNFVNQTWVEFATAVSDATPYITDSKGVSYYPWVSDAAVPDGWPFWPQTGGWNSAQNHGVITARVRAMAGDAQLPTLPPGGVGCVLAEFNRTQDGEAAIAACKRPTSDVDIPAPCGDYAKNCCGFAPACAPGSTCGWFDVSKNVKKCIPDVLPSVTLTKYPDDKDFVENLQGVTHDQSHWYFTHTDPNRIFKIPLSANLATTGPTTQHNPFPQFGHYGDPCFAAGRVFVPLEGGPNSQTAIGSVKPDFTDPVVVPTPSAFQQPWCATHGDILYTSNTNHDRVRRYRLGNGGQLTEIESIRLRKHDFGLPFNLKIISGGAVSDSGETLFLASHDLALLYAFDLPTGALRSAVQIPVPSWGCAPPPANPNTCIEFGEIEGVDFFDDPASPGIGGQVHVVLLHVQDLPGATDNYSFLHYNFSVSGIHKL